MCVDRVCTDCSLSGADAVRRSDSEGRAVARVCQSPLRVAEEVRQLHFRVECCASE